MIVHLDWDIYNKFLKAIAIDVIAKWNPDEVVAVVRGGLTATHIISKQLRMKTGTYYPANSKYSERLQLGDPDNSKKIVFVEDMICLGKTYKELHSFMATKPEIDWAFVPVAIDGKIKINELPDGEKRIIGYGFISNHWIVAPYDKTDDVPENLTTYTREQLFGARA